MTAICHDRIIFSHLSSREIEHSQRSHAQCTTLITEGSVASFSDRVSFMALQWLAVSLRSFVENTIVCALKPDDLLAPADCQPALGWTLPGRQGSCWEGKNTPWGKQSSPERCRAIGRPAEGIALDETDWPINKFSCVKFELSSKLSLMLTNLTYRALQTVLRLYLSISGQLPRQVIQAGRSSDFIWVSGTSTLGSDKWKMIMLVQSAQQRLLAEVQVAKEIAQVAEEAFHVCKAELVTVEQQVLSVVIFPWHYFQ